MSRFTDENGNEDVDDYMSGIVCENCYEPMSENEKIISEVCSECLDQEEPDISKLN